jgi:hypothetical protein
MNNLSGLMKKLGVHSAFQTVMPPPTTPPNPPQGNFTAKDILHYVLAEIQYHNLRINCVDYQSEYPLKLPFPKDREVFLKIADAGRKIEEQNWMKAPV